MRLVWALLLLYAPVALLAFWYRWDWGGTFGRRSGLWGWSARLALAVLLFFTVLIVYFGPDPALSGFGARIYLYLGMGIAIAIFPGAASTLSSMYRNLAVAGVTGLFAIIGWTLITIYGFFLINELCIRVGC